MHRNSDYHAPYFRSTFVGSRTPSTYAMRLKKASQPPKKQLTNNTPKPSIFPLSKFSPCFRRPNSSSPGREFLIIKSNQYICSRECGSTVEGQPSHVLWLRVVDAYVQPLAEASQAGRLSIFHLPPNSPWSGWQAVRSMQLNEGWDSVEDRL